jgi:hypothetical protein
LKRLSTIQPHQESSQQALQDFSTAALQALCIGLRAIDEEYFVGWLDQYNQVRIGFDLDKVAQLEALRQEIEADLSLIGVTGGDRAILV